MKPIIRNGTIYNWGNIDKIAIDGTDLKLFYSSNRVEKLGFGDKTELQKFLDNLVKELSHE